MAPVFWPFVGRQQELAFIQAAMKRVAWPGVVLAGPEGVGRTSVMKQVLTRTSRFFVPRLVHATQSAAAVPFGAVQDLLDQPGEALFTRTAAKLAGEAEQQHARRPVLMVDDAHLLDACSAALVLHLVTASNVFVLVTARSDLPAPDAIVKLWKDKLIERREIEPFSKDEIEEAVGRFLGGQVDRGTIHQLWQFSGGNPRILERLVVGAHRDGALIVDRGVWRATAPLTTGRWLPESDHERLVRLSPDLREMAALLAFGEQLSADDLEWMSDGSVLEAAEQEGLIECLPDSGPPYRRRPLRLRQHLFAETLRIETGPISTRRICRMLADCLEARGARRRCDRMRLALWRQESGRATDPVVFLEGAREASTLFDYRLAERLARTAVETGGGFAARRLLAEAMRWQGRVREVEAEYEQLEMEAADDEERTKAALGRAVNLFFGLAHAEKAEAVLEQAGGVIQDPYRKDELAVLRATIALGQGRVNAALEAVTRIFERLDEATVTTLTASTTVALPAIVWAGRAEEAAALAHHALAMAPTAAAGLAILRDDFLLSLCLADGFAGRLAEAEDLAVSRYEAALDAHADELRGEWALALGHVALVRGSVETAQRRLREAAGLLQNNVLGPYGLAWCLGCLAEAAALAGDIDAAEAALADAEAAIPRHIVVPNRELGRIWVAAARGEVPEARSLALELAASAETGGAWLLAAIALHDAVRLGAAPGDLLERLSGIADRVQGALGAAYTAHVAALVAGDGPSLRKSSLTFAELGLTLLAAEAAAEAADAYQRAGREGSAGAEEIRAKELSGACGAAHTPALELLAQLALIRKAPSLSPVEAEVARLVGKGLSNNQIAKALDTPYATVCSRLGRIYRKLPFLEHDRGQLHTWCEQTWSPGHPERAGS